jgi:hypothetical protein
VQEVGPGPLRVLHHVVEQCADTRIARERGSHAKNVVEMRRTVWIPLTSVRVLRDLKRARLERRPSNHSVTFPEHRQDAVGAASGQPVDSYVATFEAFQRQR